MLNNLISTDSNNYGDDNNLFVFFRLNEKVYAIHTSHTIEVLKLLQIDYPERLPNYIIGILNYNNLTINVVDLRMLLDLEVRGCSIQSQLLVVKTEEAIFAIIVDEVINVLPIPPLEMQFTPYKSANNLIKMIYQAEMSLVSIIDLYSVEKVLKENEFSESTYDYSKLFPTDEKSKRILAKRSYDLVRKSELSLSTDMFNHEKFVLFSLNEITYCINIKFVKELVKLKNISMSILPFAPSYIEGVINLRGEFITTLNMKKFLDLADLKKTRSKGLIVIQFEDCKVGILVDEIFNIKNIAHDKLAHQPNSKFEAKYIMAEIVEDEKVYNVLNVEKIFNDEKMFVSVES